MNKTNQSPILYVSEEECCGCSACFAICPVQAITMELTENGFRYPVIDQKKCINCGKCIKVCAFKNDLKSKQLFSDEMTDAPAIYAVKSKKADVRSGSSSGGMFTVLSDIFLENGDAVISCIYNAESRSLEYELYEDKESRDRARGSKYIQAEMKDIFVKGIKWLDEHPEKRLMFLGTGCQTAGFLQYAEKKNVSDRIVFVDLICNGVPSPGLWKDYVKYLEIKYKGRAGNVYFKDKRNGWMNPTAYLMIDKTEVPIKHYTEWFYGEYSLRRSCYQCPYTEIKRNVDITIGDFWGIDKQAPQFYDSKGVSIVILQNKKGRKIFEQIKDQIEFIQSDEESCLQPRLIAPATGNGDCHKFWNDYREKGIPYCMKKYKRKSNTSLLLRMKIIIKKIMVKLRIMKD